MKLGKLNNKTLLFPEYFSENLTKARLERSRWNLRKGIINSIHFFLKPNRVPLYRWKPYFKKRNELLDMDNSQLKDNGKDSIQDKEINQLFTPTSASGFLLLKRWIP